MSMPATWQQAELQIEGGATLKCWFNPKEYSIKKSNEWSVKAVPGAGLPSAQFTGSNSQQITLQLMFDAAAHGVEDVRGVTDQLLKMMEVSVGTEKSGNKGRPPKVKFLWGANFHFEAVVKSLEIQYLLFRPNGEPTRATASVDLTQVGGATYKGEKPKKSGNPTTRGFAGLRTHVVRDGDTLHGIAYQAYGDPSRWRAIAEENGIDDPLRLRRGKPLIIPRAPA
jgi:nucleoid-associated protein YgaU